MSDLVPIRRALLSVSDKTGLVDFATALHKEFGVELISTGGTARALREAGLPVKDVSEITGFPEMMDGRVKTLHPAVHGGLLALRDNSEHVAAMKKHGIQPIDLVCVNLYPFAQTIAKQDVSFEEAIENIDIGGPSMIRSAAKNHRSVLVVTSPDRYEKVLGDLREHQGACCGNHRLKQAQRAFAHTAEYDAAIAQYLAGKVPEKSTSKSGESQPLPAGSRRITSFATGNNLTAEPRSEIEPQYLYNLAFQQATAVSGTEAAGFVVADDGSLVNVVHIRPGECSDQQRADALRAFAEIIRPCVAAGTDGAIVVDGPDASGMPQYCLVTVLRSGNRVTAATAIIARARDPRSVAAALHGIRGVGLRVAHAWTQQSQAEQSPEKLAIEITRKQTLRYGENPHQSAGLYVHNVTDQSGIAQAKQLFGKELSYINLLDADAALNCASEFPAPAACIVKHATPCGAGVGSTIGEAFARAYESDPVAAFGGIVGLNRPVDLPAAQKIVEGQKFLEVIVAPSFQPEALELLKTRWKNVRLLECGEIRIPKATDVVMQSISGGFLVQQRDAVGLNEADWKAVTRRLPTQQELSDLRLAWLICKHVKSNAIVVASGGASVGIGGGQVDRVGAARIAIEKAGARAKGAVAASDAFFPFADGPKLLLAAGVKAIIQPGGSVRDQETIDAVNAAGATMLFTGMRHFRH